MTMLRAQPLPSNERDPWWAPPAVVALALLLAWAATVVYP